MNLSRAVLPGFGAAEGSRRRRGLLLPLLSSSSSRRLHGGGAVACCSSSSSATAAGSSRPPPPLPSFVDPAHGDPPGAAGGGIGVAEFLGAKNFLITGGTGFLAKGDT